MYINDLEGKVVLQIADYAHQQSLLPLIMTAYWVFGNYFNER